MKASEDSTQLQSLVSRAIEGDPQAQGQLIELTQDRLFKFCLLLSHNREIAEDLSQETLIKAFKNLKALKKPEALMGWLYQIAKNLFLDLKRSSSRLEVPTEEMPSTESGDPDMSVILSVQKVLSQFEPEERFLLLLVELEGYSYKEAGEMAGLSEDAVRSKLHRLRGQFVSQFEKATGKAAGND